MKKTFTWKCLFILLLFCILFIVYAVAHYPNSVSDLASQHTLPVEYGSAQDQPDIPIITIDTDFSIFAEDLILEVQEKQEINYVLSIEHADDRTQAQEAIYGNVLYEIENPEIIIIENDMVTAIKEGTTKVTASIYLDQKTKRCDKCNEIKQMNTTFSVTVK